MGDYGAGMSEAQQTLVTCPGCKRVAVVAGEAPAEITCSECANPNRFNVAPWVAFKRVAAAETVLEKCHTATLPEGTTVVLPAGTLLRA